MDFLPTATLARFASGEIRIHVRFHRTIRPFLVHA